MHLHELTPPERRSLAASIGSSPEYLWQIATGRRKPSCDLAKAMVKADPRLTLVELRPDVFADLAPSQPQEAA